MYERLKSLAKRTLPDRLLTRYDDEFRRLNAVWYRGDAVACNCCRRTFSKWIKLSNEELLCPRCGSLPRTRRLYGLLTRGYLRPNIRILHFSPSRSISRRLAKTPGIIYDTTDYVGEFQAKFRFDILDIDIPDGTYHLVVCYHVLEHIEDDRRAMAELYRVLKPGGSLLVQTPFGEGDTYEDYSITAPADRREAFGQEDHVRVYSVNGLAERLKETGLEVRVTTYPADGRAGLKAGETVLHCRRPILASVTRGDILAS